MLRFRRPKPVKRFWKLAAWLCVLLAPMARVSHASGPRWTAGVNNFNPAAMGTPIVWPNGQVQFWMDQGNLSSAVSRSQAVSMVNNGASVWTSVSTAAVSISMGGQLAEDVSGSNVTANTPSGTGAQMPADVLPSATNRPVGIILDSDGSVLNAMYGSGASDPSNCVQNAALAVVDNMAATGSIAHGLMILNGLCTSTPAQIALMQYEIVRAWGHLLGLDWSQVNDSAVRSDTYSPAQLAGWPVMHPAEWQCAAGNYQCMPGGSSLRLDDIAGLNRLYPVTSSNINSFSGKTLTAPNTVSVQGSILFPSGQGMQGVNVVLTPIINGTPAVQYSVSAVSGAMFHGNAGNCLMGTTDPDGNVVNQFGTSDPAMEGFFNLSGTPLPPGVSTAVYELTFEAINPSFTNATLEGTEVNYSMSILHSVGAYLIAQVAPSGTLAPVNLGTLSAGSAVTQTITVADAANEPHTNDGTQSQPGAVNPGGEWEARLTGYGHAGWYQFSVAANRTFTIEAQSLDELGLPTENKAAVVIGLWSASDPVGSAPDVWTWSAFNGQQTGLTITQASSGGGGAVLVAFADQRGDGRPDFRYTGRLLYADNVVPTRIPLTGGSITVHGTGFRPGAQVLVNGVLAVVTSVSPTEITAVAPASAGAAGVVTVQVQDPLTGGYAVIPDGLSYDAEGSDQITVVSAPSGNVPEAVPVPFTVHVTASDGLTPAANVAVTYSVTQGAAALGCGSSSCVVLTNGSGLATLSVTPSSTQSTTVRASISNGESVLASFAGTTPPGISALQPTLYVAAGARFSWQPTALVLNGTTPVASAGVVWAATGSASVSGTSTTTGSNGQTSTTVTAGPMAANASATVRACEASNLTQCTQFTVDALDPTPAVLGPISGVGQVLAVGTSPAAAVLQVSEAGLPLAGATVTFYEQLTAWQPACAAGGRCPAPQVLATATVSATSDANGMVTLAPLSLAGTATNLAIQASTGAQGSLQFSIEQHP